MSDAPTPPDPQAHPDPASWWAEPPVPAAAAPAGGDGDPAGTTAPARSSRRPLLWATAAAVVVGLIGGGAFAATRDDGTAEVATDGAATALAGETGGPALSTRGPGAMGTIASIDGTTLTVEGDDDTTTTVTTDDDTSVTDTADAELADIAVGDTVSVLGEADDDGVVTADRIVEGDLAGAPMIRQGGPPDGAMPPEGMEPPEGMAPPGGAVRSDGPGGATAGEVTAIDGDTLTVTTDEGDEVTVVTTGDTTVTVTTEIAVSDLAVGDTVAVMGTEDGDAVAAESIRRGELLLGGPGGGPGR